MVGPYDIAGNFQPLSPNFAKFQVLSAAPQAISEGRSYYDLTQGIGVYANGQWNYASGGGGGAVASVFGRTGAVTAQSGDYTFAQIGSTPTTVSGYGITDAVTLTGAQTLTNKSLTSPSMTSPVLGTPTSGTLSNCTGYAVANISGLGAGVATFLATPSSANLATAVTGETGTGALVFGTSPTITTPTIAALANLTTNGFVKTSGGNGTLSVDTTSYSAVLAKGTVSNSATLTIDFSSYYTNYNTLEVQIVGLVPVTTDTTLTMVISADGTNYDTGAGSYEWASSFMAGGTGFSNGGGSTSATSITICQHVVTGSGGNASYTIRIHNVSAGTLRPFFTIDGVNTGTSSAMLANKTYAQRLNAQVCRAIRLQMSSGNISSAYYKVTGTIT